MRIVTFDDIYHPDLISGWNKLFRNATGLPFSSYAWASAWMEFTKHKLTFSGVAVLDTKGAFMGFAPLCIERATGIRILRSMPVKYGGFFEFLIAENENQDEIIKSLLGYLLTFSNWDLVRLDKVRETSPLHSIARNTGDWKVLMDSGYVQFDLPGQSWETYLKSLKTSTRRNIRSRLRKLEGTGNITFKSVDSWQQYEQLKNDLEKMYSSRIDDTSRKQRGSAELSMISKLIRWGFETGNLKLYLLLKDDDLLAYRLGWIHERAYYDWHTSFDISYRNLHPGICIMCYVIQSCIRDGIDHINFMGGLYPWKLNFSPDQELSYKNNIMASSGNLLANCYLNWHLYKQKKVFHKIQLST